jgi:hypothetical protein
MPSTILACKCGSPPLTPPNSHVQIRIATAFYRSFSLRLRSQKIIRNSASGQDTHPLFVPVPITSRTPLFETDYNLHKSNSTYFSDLDISRTACVTKLFSPGLGHVSKELETHSDKAKRKLGRVSVILGSVFTTFGREISPYVKYEVQTRLLSWDQKWMYLVSYFIMPQQGKDGKQVVYASSLSKYVSKKGRWTIPPEMILRKSGLLPENPTVGLVDESLSGTPREGEAGITTIANGSALSTAVDRIRRGSVTERSKEELENNMSTWSWERIEQERVRGLKVVESFKALDGALADEWEVHRGM